MRDPIDKARAKQRAIRCWQLMDDNEKATVRFGMSPHWTALENLGGKAPAKEGWEVLQGDAHRLSAVALMEVADRDGGMIA